MIPEPEAAAIAVLRSVNAMDLGQSLRPGDVALVCDCGGGTIDITTYIIRQFSPNFVFDELVTGTGGKCGSTVSICRCPFSDAYPEVLSIG